MRIADYLQLPASTDIDQFIVRLSGDGWSPEAENDNLRTYVVTSSLRPHLNTFLTATGASFAQNKTIGRFIYGTFGSGKSHLMTVLGKMLERDEKVYAIGHRALRELRHEQPWLDQRKTLVVRLNMMGRDNLRGALYDAYTEAVEKRGHVPPNLSDHEEIFRRFEADGVHFPGGFEARLATAIADEPRLAEWHLTRETGSLEAKLNLAALVKGWRDHGSADAVAGDDVRVTLREGVKRIAQHAKDNGYDGIAWLIDELVIWLRGKKAQGYASQINDLSSLVDGSIEGPVPKAVPFLVVVAVQHDIQNTCPEDMSEAGFREKLGHVADRFRPHVTLEEQDLYQVAEQRVLALREDLSAAKKKEFTDAVDAFLAKRWPDVEKLAGGLEKSAVRHIYPFHPALLRILVDTTQALSRNRTAIGALFRLIRAYDTLEVGQFIPVGGLWEVLFDADGIVQAKQSSTGTLAQRLNAAIDTWVRLEAKVAATGVDEDEKRGLAQVVRTTLLAQLADRGYYKDGRPLHANLTARTLWLLNQRDVPALNETTAGIKVAGLLRRLQSTAAEVVLSQDNDPVVRIETHRVDIQAVLDVAKANVSGPNRLAAIRELVDGQLGLGLGSSTQVLKKIGWRGTDRAGVIRFANVRTLSYAGATNEFAPASNEAFLLLIDYPYDEDSSKTRQDDIDTVSKARERASQWTLAWLPEHMAASEFEALTTYAAIQLIGRDDRTYISDKFAPAEAQLIKGALATYREAQKSTLEHAIRRVYFADGLIRSMRSELDIHETQGAQHLDHQTAPQKLAERILDARFPLHPALARKVTKPDLATVADILVRALKTGASQAVSTAHAGLVHDFALPLELAYLGTGTVGGREDGKFLTQLKKETEGKKHVQAKELREKMGPDGDWKWGLTREVTDLLLFVLVFVRNYEVRVGGTAKTVQGLLELPESCDFVQEDVVENAVWDKAVAAALDVLNIPKRNVVISASEQGKLVKDVVEAAKALREPRLADFLSKLEALLVRRSVVTSQRKAEATALRAALDAVILGKLDGVAVAGNSADRVRIVASWRDRPDVKAWKDLRSKITEEVAALDKISDKLSMLHFIDTNGDENHKLKTSKRLANLLSDGMAIPLSSVAKSWADDVEAVFKELTKTPTPPPPPDPPIPPAPTPPPPEKTKKRVGVSRADLASSASAMAADVLAHSGSAKFTIIIVDED